MGGPGSCRPTHEGAAWAPRSLVEGRARGAGTDATRAPAGLSLSHCTQSGKPVTVIGLWRLTQELTGGPATTHGFRATFRDWAAEQTAFAREVAELALAPSTATIPSKPICVVICSRSVGS